MEKFQSNRELRSKIIMLLEAKGELTARDIAKEIYGENGTPTMVNPELYSMLSSKLVTKTTVGAPKWKLNNLNREIREKVLKYLTDNPGEKSPIDICQAVVDQTITRKMINPVLYSLLGEGKVTKTSDDNGKNPKWCLSHPI